MKRARNLVGLMIVMVVALVLFYSRQILSFRYNPEYYENYFYYSQWNIPNSTRGISDGDLFKFIGYRLAEGDNPFDINYEVPPFGKYLYGLSEKYTGNPYWVSIGFYLGSLLIFLLLARELLEDELVVRLGLLIFASLAFVATQIRDVMLDLPLMFMFLLHTLMFVRYLKRDRLVDLVAAGLFLGLASGTKLGIYAPLAVLMETIFVLRTKNWLRLFVLPVATVAGYLAAYVMYFIKHQNPIPWLRLHKKIYTFYSGSLGNIDYLNQLKTIFLNSYQGWWQPEKMIQVSDWSIVFPLGVVAMVLVLVFAWKKKNVLWGFVAGLTLVILVMNNLVPFWPRYLMPATPLFVLLISYLFRKRVAILLLIALLNLPILVKVMANEDIPGHTEAVARFMSTRAYRELYRSIRTQDQKAIDEKNFIETAESFFDDLGTRDVEVRLISKEVRDDKLEVEYESKYETRYGEMQRMGVFEYEKEMGQWKLVWDWDYLWPDFDGGRLVINESEKPIQGIKDQAGRLAATKGKGYEVYMIPRLMYHWTQDLDTLSAITGENSMDIDGRIKRTVPDDFPRFVGYFDPDKGENGLELAKATPGVILKETDYLVSTGISNIGGLAREAAKTRSDLFYVPAEVRSEDGSLLFESPDVEETVFEF